MIVCCTVRLHRDSDEGLQAETSAVYVNISILQYIEKEDCREDRSTQILLNNQLSQLTSDYNIKSITVIDIL